MWEIYQDIGGKFLMKKRTYFLFIILFSVIGTSFLYVYLSSKETFVPGIPAQAIRLRILANSDTLEDQLVKRKVRDEIVKEMNSWVKKPTNIEEARVLVNEHLPSFSKIAQKVVLQNGYTYPVKVDFGQIPFPTKLYGNKVYAAGNYEALRVTLGDGDGGNWWCVLFPPLCFVDMSNSDAIEKQPELSVTEGEAYAASEENIEEQHEIKKKKPVEVRFLFIDKVKALLN